MKELYGIYLYAIPKHTSIVGSRSAWYLQCLPEFPSPSPYLSPMSASMKDFRYPWYTVFLTENKKTDINVAGHPEITCSDTIKAFVQGH